jgi:hypothetical protein
MWVSEMDDDLKRLLDAKHVVPADAIRSLAPAALDELDELARGDVPQALELLVEVEPERVAEYARALVADESREPALRALSARLLARTQGQAAETELISLAATDHPTVAAAALRELGGVGTSRCLDVVARRGQSEDLAPLATLTAALVAFRSGVEGFEPELPAVRADDVVAWDEAIQVERIAPDEAFDIARQLRTYGAELSPAEAERFDCRGRRYAALLVAEIMEGGTIVLPPSGRLVAVVGAQAEADQSWSTALLALAWPAKRGHAVGVFRTDGQPVYGGTIDAGGTFELSGLVGGGRFSAHVRGEAGDGLRFDEARSGVTEQRAVMPTRTPPSG